MKRRVYISLTIALIIVIASLAIRYEIGIKKSGSSGSTNLVVGTSTENPWLTNETLEKINDILEKPVEMTGADSVNTNATNSKPIIPTTATDRLAQELFVKYVEISKTGVTIDEEISSKLAENLLAQDYSEPEKLYLASNIKVQSDTSPSGLKKYGNSLGAILSTPSTGYQSEIEILLKIVNEPVDRYIDDLTAQKNRYLGIQSKLLTLPAPQQIARAQADLINAITLFIGAIDGALAIETDPVGAVTKIGSYDNGLTLLTNSLDEYKKYFTVNKIKFSPAESGSLLVE